MAIAYVVETGSGSSTATSYVTLVNLKQYWDNMGYSYAAITDAELQAHANKATKIIDGQYFSVWPGERSTSTQALQWPRINAAYPGGLLISSSTIPQELQDALSEMAYVKSAGTDIAPVDTSQGNVLEYNVRVEGAVSEGKVYAKGTFREHPIIPAVDDLIRMLTGRTGFYGGVELRRV